jgi:hypothetical protein
MANQVDIYNQPLDLRNNWIDDTLALTPKRWVWMSNEEALKFQRKSFIAGRILQKTDDFKEKSPAELRCAARNLRDLVKRFENHVGKGQIDEVALQHLRARIESIESIIKIQEFSSPQVQAAKPKLRPEKVQALFNLIANQDFDINTCLIDAETFKRWDKKTDERSPVFFNKNLVAQEIGKHLEGFCAGKSKEELAAVIKNLKMIIKKFKKTGLLGTRLNPVALHALESRVAEAERAFGVEPRQEPARAVAIPQALAALVDALAAPFSAPADASPREEAVDRGLSRSAPPRMDRTEAEREQAAKAEAQARAAKEAEEQRARRQLELEAEAKRQRDLALACSFKVTELQTVVRDSLNGPQQQLFDAELAERDLQLSDLSDAAIQAYNQVLREVKQEVDRLYLQQVEEKLRTARKELAAINPKLVEIFDHDYQGNDLDIEAIKNRIIEESKPKAAQQEILNAHFISVNARNGNGMRDPLAQRALKMVKVDERSDQVPEMFQVAENSADALKDASTKRLAAAELAQKKAEELAKAAKLAQAAQSDVREQAFKKNLKNGYMRRF